MNAQWPLLIVALLTGSGGWLLAATCGQMLAGGAGAHVRARLSHEISLGLVIVAMIAGIVVEGVSLGRPSALIQTLSRPGSAAFALAVSLIASIILAIVTIVASRRHVGATPMRVICALAVIAGIATAVSGGAEMIPSSFSAWNTPLLPAALFGTEAAVGTPLFFAFEAIAGSKRETKGLTIAGIIAIVGGIIATACAAIYVGKTGLVGLTESSNTALWGIGAIVCAALTLVLAVGAWVARHHRLACIVLTVLAVVCGILCCIALRLYMGDFAVRRFNLVDSPMGRLSGR